MSQANGPVARSPAAQSDFHGQRPEFRQLNPHFLFNALNAIACLVMEDPKQAESMIIRLANYCRRVLTLDLSSRITVEEELQLLEMYAGIEKVRFEDQLQISVDVAEDGAASAKIPPLLLQSIVENSIRQGLRAYGPPTHIAVSAHKQAGHLCLTVEDDGCLEANQSHKPRETLHIIKTRLQQEFSNDFKFTAKVKSTGGLLVRICIPESVKINT